MSKMIVHPKYLPPGHSKPVLCLIYLNILLLLLFF